MFTLDTVQIKGVDSTVRKTDVELGENAKLYVIEKLMTHDSQTAQSDMEVQMNGSGSSAQIISRSVVKGESRQVFHRLLQYRNHCKLHPSYRMHPQQQEYEPALPLSRRL